MRDMYNLFITIVWNGENKIKSEKCLYKIRKISEKIN